MTVNIINSLESAADAYIAQPDSQVFEAVVEWLAASYERDGYAEPELDRMDFTSAAQDYINHRRERHPG